MKLLLTLVLAVGLAGSALAENRDKARDAFRLGSQHYALGEYKEALAAFKEAYRNFEDPSFLFNIAQCERQLDQRADAIRAYRMYLVTAPEATNRDEVRGLIARLEHEVAEEHATKAAPPPGVQPPGVAVAHEQAPPTAAASSAAPASSTTPALILSAAPARRHETPTYKKWWVWTLVGVAVAGGAAAGLAIAFTRNGGSTPTANTSFGTASPF